MTHRIKLVSVLVVIFAITAVVAVGARHKALKTNHTDLQSNPFDSYMMLIPRFIHQHAPYVDDAFPLPPFAMLFVAPFTLLSRPNAQVGWILCKPFMFIAIFIIMRSIVRRVGVELHPYALILIAVAWFFPVFGDVQEGQMNLLMLLPLILSLWFAQRQSRGGDLVAGLFLAMAICIKVTPLAFIPYFLLRRRWALVAWACAGIFLWLLVVPALFFGWNQNLVWLAQWYNIMIRPYVVHSDIKFSNGESIPEFITRFLSHSPAWSRFSPSRQLLAHYSNILDLPASFVHFLGRAVLFLIGLAGLWWARHQIPSFRCRRYVMEIACVSSFMLWASERTWVHHYVTLIVALMAAGMIASDALAAQRSRKWAWSALLAAAALIPFTSDLADVFSRDGRRYVESLDFVLIASLGLAMAIVLSVYPNNADRETQPDAAGRSISATDD